MSQKNYAIILAGGTGLRMSVDIPKQFLTIDKLPIIVRTLNVFQNHDKIDGIIVVVYPEYIDRVKQYANEYSLTKILNIVAGGETRQISSYNGLHAWDFKDDDIIIFHDAVRPFLTNEIINDCISGVLEIGAVDVCVKTTDTIVESSNDNTILSLPDRTNLRNGQTPQAFTYKLILDAHENAKKNNFTQTTDDVRLVHNLGHPVKIIEGNYENIKITNPEDIILSEAIAKNTKKIKVYKNKKIRLTKPYCFEEFNESIELVQNEIALVQPIMGSICQADLRYFTGNRRPEVLKKKLPMSLLHEGIGIVKDSNGNPNLNEGDRVIIIPNIPGCVYEPNRYTTFSNECSFCGTNFIYENHCKYVKFLSSGYDGLTQSSMLHYAKCLIKIPNDVSDKAATMSELLTVAYNAVKRIEMKRSSHIMIFGDGPVGYATAIVIRKVFNFPKNQVHIIGIDNTDKFDFAMTCHYNDISEYKAPSPDYVFECVGGHASGNVINKSIELINPVGTIVLMGVSEENIPINSRDILEKGLTLIGSSRSSRYDYAELIPHLSDKETSILIEKLIIPQSFKVKTKDDLTEVFKFAENKKDWGKIVLNLEL